MQEKQRPFETDRTRAFRTTELSKRDESTISHIERFGCEVELIAPTHDAKAWAFTVGVYDTGAHFEILVVGLRPEAAQFLLNESARRLRQGINLLEGRHSGLLGDVECEFRPVDPKWIKHLMGWAIWYYGGTNFPVLQAIYPDRKNLFPEEEGFNAYFRQPFLQSGAPMTRMEEDFWASADPNSILFDWKFPDPPHTMVFLSETVNSVTEAVTYVSHDREDGAWQFLGDSMDEGGGPVISCFHHPIDKDPSLKELFDLPIGWCAERSQPGEPWIRRELPPEEDTEDTLTEEASQ